MLTKEAIMAAVDIAVETVHVPEWGGDVKVRGLTGAQRDQYEQMLLGQREKSGAFYNIRATLCVLAIVDDNGNQLFDVAEIDALGKKSAAALDRIADVIRRISGLAPEAVEDAEKNL